MDGRVQPVQPVNYCESGLLAGVADEGGLRPQFSSNEEALSGVSEPLRLQASNQVKT